MVLLVIFNSITLLESIFLFLLQFIRKFTDNPGADKFLALF